jgi:hypothetical protein
MSGYTRSVCIQNIIYHTIAIIILAVAGLSIERVFIAAGAVGIIRLAYLDLRASKRCICACDWGRIYRLPDSAAAIVTDYCASFCAGCLQGIE